MTLKERAEKILCWGCNPDEHDRECPAMSRAAVDRVSAGLVAENEECAEVDFTKIIYEAAKRTGKDKRLALYDLHEMAKDIAAAIRDRVKPCA